MLYLLFYTINHQQLESRIELSKCRWSKFDGLIISFLVTVNKYDNRTYPKYRTIPKTISSTNAPPPKQIEASSHAMEQSSASLSTSSMESSFFSHMRAAANSFLSEYEPLNLLLAPLLALLIANILQCFVGVVNEKGLKATILGFLITSVK